MKKLALCVGINDYPGSGADLHGCVNDAIGWQRLLDEEGYITSTLLDDQASKAEVVGMLGDMVSRLRFGDRLVFTYSGHGSWVPDTDADEMDGRDECLVLHDYQSGGLLTDDELHSILQQRRWGSRVVLLSDSCHSGSVTRFTNLSRGLPRFMSPSMFLGPQDLNRALKVEHVPPMGKPRSGTVLISGCDDPEYSYDAYIEGKPQGAFTAAALKHYRPGIRFGAWFDAIRTELPNASYPQSPQLIAKYYQRYWSL